LADEESMRGLSPSIPHAAPSQVALVARVVGMWAAYAMTVGFGMAAIPGEPPGLPPLVRTKQRTFTIPFRLPPSQDPDADAAPQRVELHVSRDLGGRWDKAGDTSPATGSFSYTADVDGEYWFRLRAIDRKGRGRGSAGADMRVLVDAAGPRLAGRVWKGIDGEIVCRFAAADDSIDVGSLTVEYRAAGDPGWKKVAAEGILARQAPAHLVGEEIWWAGEKVDSLTVRIAVADAAGNQTVRQFTLEPADPRIDQAALAGEIGVPPLPRHGGDGHPGYAASAAAPFEDFAGPASPAAGPGVSPPGAWPAESARWTHAPAEAAAGRGPTASGGLSSPGSAPPGFAADPVGQDAPGHSVLVREQGLASLPRSGPLATPVTAALPAGTASAPHEHQGRPLHLTRSRRFAWDYEMPPAQTHDRPLRAELWSTRDGGVTWQRTAVDDDGQSPIEVQLPEAGMYGVRLEIVAAGDDGRPRSGAVPDCWVGVDEEPPVVELDVRRQDGVAPVVMIRYAAHDGLPAARGGRLLYSPLATGPWVTIATDLDNAGEFRWEPDRGVPARVFLRAEVVDAAGNVGAATTTEPLALGAPRTGGRLGGLTPLP